MKLRELLKVTAMNTNIKIDCIENRNKYNLCVLNKESELNRIVTTEWDSPINQFGDLEVNSQYMDGNFLVILTIK